MKNQHIWKILLLVIVACAAHVLYQKYCAAVDASRAASCANHFIQHRTCLRTLNDQCPGLILPTGQNTRKNLAEIYAKGTNLHDTEWLSSGGSACPESIKRDGSIGYIYVGDGLSLDDVIQKNILILFCPAENHQGYSQHCHGFLGQNSSICFEDNAAMIKELERAITRGESGEVNYTERAMKVLREQLEKRKGFEKARQEKWINF